MQYGLCSGRDEECMHVCSAVARGVEADWLKRHGHGFPVLEGRDALNGQ